MSKFRLIFNKFPKYTSVQELQRNKQDVTVHVVAFVIIPVLVYIYTYTPQPRIRKMYKLLSSTDHRHTVFIHLLFNIFVKVMF